jgi:hypothetical protein
VKPGDLQTWLEARLPADLLAAPPEVRIYSDEILIVLSLAAPSPSGAADEGARRQAEQQLIDERRNTTRSLRIKLARELQKSAGLPVAWGMRFGSCESLFTTRSSPVMTRLGRAERDLLDTLVAAGVAETRSSALAFVVRAFAAEHDDWLAEVRETIAQMEQARSRLKLTARRGPPAGASEDEGPKTKDESRPTYT